VTNTLAYLEHLSITPVKHFITTGRAIKIFIERCLKPGNNKGGSITVPLTSCLTGLEQSVLQRKTKIVSGHTADSKPVKQEVNGTVILPPLYYSLKKL
jgi:hypothetical protein